MLWSTATGKRLATHSLPRVSSIATSSPADTGPQVVLSEHGDGLLFLRSEADLVMRKSSISFGSAYLTKLTVSRRGHLAAAGSFGGTIWILDTATSRVRHRFRGRHPVVGLVFSRRGRRLAALTTHAVRLWDVTTGRLLSQINGAFPEGPIALSAGGRRVALATHGGIDVWQVRREEAEEPLHFSTRRKALALAFTSDGQALASGHCGGVLLWSLRGGVKPTDRFRTPGGCVTALDISRHGKVLATGHADGSALLWRLSSITLRRPRTLLH